MGSAFVLPTRGAPVCPGRENGRIEAPTHNGVVPRSLAQRALACQDTGRGEPLVLVHGLATTRIIWRRVVPLLRHRRVVAVDLPGFGASPPVGPGYDLEAVAERLAEGLEAAGIEEPYDLVGHSLGGAVALTLAARRPERVRALVLAASAGMRPMPRAAASVLGVAGDRMVRVRRGLAPLSDLAWARRVLFAFGTTDPRGIPPAEARAMLAASRDALRTRVALAAVLAADLRPLLESTTTPIGLLWGEHDRIIPSSGIGAVLARRPGAPTATVADAGTSR